MADIDWEQPDTFPYKGRWNNEEYLNEAIDLRDFVVDYEGDLRRHEFATYSKEEFVVLRGPLKVAVSTENMVEEPPKHATEIVTVPSGKTVRFANESMVEGKTVDLNMGLSPVSVPKPLQTAVIFGGASGGAGAVGGHYLMENPLVGIATAIVGGGAGYWWENSQYAEYGVKRVE